MPTAASVPLFPALNPAGLVEILLNTSLNGIMLLRPLYAADGEQLIDFAWERLNPAAQRMLQLPERPTDSFLTLFPASPEVGVFGFYREAFLSGRLELRQNLYQHDGLDGYYMLQAHRYEGVLVVSFTDGNDQPRSVVEEALRESQAREQAARAEVERQRNQWQALINQAPVAIGLFEGPELQITAANPLLSSMWGRTQAEVLDRPLLEAVPELQGQNFEELMRQVRETRVPFVGTEVPAQLLHDGQLRTAYFSFVYQPLYDAQGEVLGVLDVVVDVTEQVLARQRVEQLNQELEAQVLVRTQELRLAYLATEQQREQLYQVFEQTPLAIAILRGPNLRIELANPAVAAIWGREVSQVLGRPYLEVLPDTANQGFEQILSDVLTTGESFTITDAPVTLARAHTGQPTQAYVSFTFQPLRAADGEINGLVASGIEVTDQVLARQQVQRLNEQLRTNNEVLESRVQDRTREAQQARTIAERQRGELIRVLEQAPVAIAVYRGPQYIIELANPTVCRLWGRQQEDIIGKGLFEALPEVAGMGYEELLNGVMATGEPYVAHAMPAQHDRNGRRETVYWDFVYVAMYEDDGSIYGAMVVATEVTEQVLARQRVQQLNDELEVRVQARTAEAQAALHEAQDQREQLREQQNLLRQILAQVPASVATLDGPEHRFSFFNDRYYALSGNRAALNLTVAETLPEVGEQGFLPLLDQVYASGETFIGKEISILLEQPEGPAIQQFLDFTYQPLTDRQGQVHGILAFVLDVTEQVRTRRQAETLQAAALAAVQRRAQQRQELYQIFAQTPVAIVLLREPDHRIEYFNPAFEELFPPEEWMGTDLHGHTLTEVYPRIETAGLATMLDRVYTTGEPQAVIDMPLAELHPGSPRYVTLSYQAYREEGRIVGVTAFAYDVTEQVQGRRDAEVLQAALLAGAQRSAEERQELLTLFERAPVAVALLREPDHRLEYFNTAFGELYPGQDLLGKPVVEAYPGMAADVIGRLDRVYETGKTYQGQEQPLRTATLGGAPRYVTFTYQAYREHERIAGVAVFIHEVTEQVRARQARETQQAALQHLFEQAPVAICMFQGAEYLLELVNPLMGEMLGHAPTDLLNQPFFEALPELADQGLRELLDEVRRTGVPFVAQEQPIRLARPGIEATGYFNFVYQPLQDPTGVAAVVCVATEVTDQVLARQQVQSLNEELATINEEMQATNEELNDTNTRLSRTNTDLDTFVYTASHDLKAPIANIEGLLLALRQQLPAEALQADLVPRLLDLMADSVARFQQTIGHLTDISQLQQTETLETLDLTALINGITLDLAPLIESSAATLTVAVEGCKTLRVAPKTLRSVVYNLLSNAVKYRDPDRPAQVQLRAYCASGQLVLAVQDNGLGLSKAQQGELFGMFRRLHVHIEGSGVGLFMVKRLVENAGGTVTVASQPGVGSIFTVSLPA